MNGAVYPLPQYAFMAWCSVKAQGQLYLFTLNTRDYTQQHPIVTEISQITKQK